MSPETSEAPRLDLPVRGMHCAACVGKVERALRSVPGVVDASVNLATERARVELGPRPPALPELRAAVAAAGYAIPEEIAVTPIGRACLGDLDAAISGPAVPLAGDVDAAIARMLALVERACPEALDGLGDPIAAYRTYQELA